MQYLIIINLIKETKIEWNMLTQMSIYMNIAFCLILALLARSDFIGLLIGIYVFVLFVYQDKLEILDNMKRYLIINSISTVYDLCWLAVHLKGYWSGSKYDYAEIGLKKYTYFFSFLNFLVKIVLLVSLSIKYEKAKKTYNTLNSIKNKKLNYYSNNDNVEAVRPTVFKLTNSISNFEG